MLYAMNKLNSKPSITLSNEFIHIMRAIPDQRKRGEPTWVSRHYLRKKSLHCSGCRGVPFQKHKGQVRTVDVSAKELKKKIEGEYLLSGHEDVWGNIRLQHLP